MATSLVGSEKAEAGTTDLGDEVEAHSRVAAARELERAR